jgi:ABC-2 type transport system ATP-binding protein
MQQKLQFIGTILHEPEIVILDEPFSGLDPINQRVLRDIVGELRREGRTILFSTHIIEHAERICDHVCIIARGARVVDGPVARVKREHGERYVALAVDPGQDALPVLNASPLVHEIHDDGGGGGGGGGQPGGPHLVRLHDGADANALLEDLVRARVRLRRFELVEPSLEQIFIDRVGPPDAAAADLEAALHV